MPSVPDRLGGRSNPVTTPRAAWHLSRAEAEVLRYRTRAWVTSAKDQIDTDALADALMCASEEEMRFFDYGMGQADASEVKRELLLRKLELFSQVNNRRISRRFRPDFL